MNLLLLTTCISMQKFYPHEHQTVVKSIRTPKEGLPVYRAAGLPGCRSTGLPVYRSTGLPFYRPVGLPGCRSTGLQLPTKRNLKNTEFINTVVLKV